MSAGTSAGLEAVLAGAAAAVAGEPEHDRTVLLARLERDYRGVVGGWRANPQPGLAAQMALAGPGQRVSELHTWRSPVAELEE